MKLIPLKGGDEYDALNRRWKNYIHWRAGERKRLKRKFNKRVRRKNKEALKGADLFEEPAFLHIEVSEQ